MSPRCVCAMGVHQALALFGDTKQAMGEGKSGPVELNRTNQTGGYGPAIQTTTPY